MSYKSLREEFAELHKSGVIVTTEKRKIEAKEKGRRWKESRIERRARSLADGHAEMLTEEQRQKELPG